MVGLIVEIKLRFQIRCMEAANAFGFEPRKAIAS